ASADPAHLRDARPDHPQALERQHAALLAGGRRPPQTDPGAHLRAGHEPCRRGEGLRARAADGAHDRAHAASPARGRADGAPDARGDRARAPLIPIRARALRAPRNGPGPEGPPDGPDPDPPNEPQNWQLTTD